MKKIILRRIHHRGAWRIGIYFDYDEALKELVKQIPGSVFSITNRCFYVDDSEENLRYILKVLKDSAYVDISSLLVKEEAFTAEIVPAEKPEDHAMNKFTQQDVPGSKSSRPIKSRDELLPRVVVAGESLVSVPEKSDSTVSRSGNFDPVEFRISEREGLLVVRFTRRYDPGWIDELRTYGQLRYDKIRREWLLPWAKITVDSLADYFAAKNIKVNVTRHVVDPRLATERKNIGDEIRGRVLGGSALEGLEAMAIYLDENRYSGKTRESYMAMLEFFFRYFSPRDPLEITEDHISRFIYDYIIKLGYSPAYQNQMVSAIKIFYSITGRGRVRPDFLERPRRRRALPKVLSKEEVSLILNSGRNIKHKLILWLIYSCGLRRSEVINIKVSDLDRERNIILIRQGKGGVDRIVPVSQKVWEKTDEYIRSYAPRAYLFEGQAGRRYSAESVYRLFKDAMERAGIKKDVGVHCLRHSYATHLHESGLDIRYIQELLGHKSTRTTEIYTHVSRRNLVQVRSPIDDLDVK